MLSSSEWKNPAKSAYKSVRSSQQIAQYVPEGAMLLNILKAVEQRLQSKGLLRKPPEPSFYPLWFLAETERNVYLWRNGRSLTKKDEFEFWIDIEKLITKRIAALSSCPDHEMQFANPGWSIPVPDKELAKKERQYLLTLAALIERIQSHAHALSHVGLILEKEITPSCENKRVVLLPA